MEIHARGRDIPLHIFIIPVAPADTSDSGDVPTIGISNRSRLNNRRRFCNGVIGRGGEIGV